VTLMSGCQMAPTPAPTEPRIPGTYLLAYVPRPAITIDGKLDEKAWAQADPETDFHLPWEMTPVPRTEFRAFCDDANLYFSLRAFDDNLVVAPDFPNEATVDAEDRLELFFCRDVNVNTVYCLEIDPLGRTHDFKGTFTHWEFDHAWTCEGLKTAGTMFDKGYVVEGLIPLKTLGTLGMESLLAGGTMRVGLFRAEFRRTGQKVEMHWISWIDLPAPKFGFHTRQFMGSFRMKQPPRIGATTCTTKDTKGNR